MWQKQIEIASESIIFKKVRIENAIKEDEGVYECRSFFKTPDNGVQTVVRSMRIIIGEEDDFLQL